MATSKQHTSVSAYIETFPKEVQVTLRVLRKIILDILSGSEERINYNIPAFFLHGQYIIYFAGWKKHVSLYPYTEDMTRHFQSETSAYKVSGKGTIQFPLNKPLPVELIRKIAEFRLREVQLSQKHQKNAQ